MGSDRVDPNPTRFDSGKKISIRGGCKIGFGSDQKIKLIFDSFIFRSYRIELDSDRIELTRQIGSIIHAASSNQSKIKLNRKCRQTLLFICNKDQLSFIPTKIFQIILNVRSYIKIVRKFKNKDIK
jgi:hypothetical protein